MINIIGAEVVFLFYALNVINKFFKKTVMRYLWMVKYALYVKKTGKYYFNTKFNDYDEFKQKEETIEEMKLKIMYDKAEENDMEGLIILWIV